MEKHLAPKSTTPRAIGFYLHGTPVENLFFINPNVEPREVLAIAATHLEAIYEIVNRDDDSGPEMKWAAAFLAESAKALIDAVYESLARQEAGASRSA